MVDLYGKQQFTHLKTLLFHYISSLLKKKMAESNMQLTSALGVQFWNDSCAHGELSEAVEQGAVGATSNPVIVHTAVTNEKERWMPTLERVIIDNPYASPENLAWKFVQEVGIEAAKLLLPVYEDTNGEKGFLSIQLPPSVYDDSKKMVEEAIALGQRAPNIAVKVPAIPTGFSAMEEIVANGINVNSTVSFTVPQAIAAAQAMERGLERAKKAGYNMRRMHPYVTLMVGRLDDLLRRVIERDPKTYEGVDPSITNWAGIVVVKKVHDIFQQRGYRAIPLSAAYRTLLHWSELIGEGIIQTLPYKWWQKVNSEGKRPSKTLKMPISEEILHALYQRFTDFKAAYDENGMPSLAFINYGATVHTLKQFREGFENLVNLVKERTAQRYAPVT